MKQLPIPVLKACLRVGIFLCSLSVSSGFDGRTGLEDTMGCVFFWFELVAATLVQGRAGAGGERPKPNGSSGLCPSAVVISAILGSGP